MNAIDRRKDFIEIKGFKKRFCPDGLLLFNKKTGINILLDEIKPPESEWSKSSRFVSIALTNACELTCAHCYAPKNKSILDFNLLKSWLCSLDLNGCIGIGVGGGEPTLYPKFIDLCDYVSNETNLALTMTTHGHRLTPDLVEKIHNKVNFIRVSMDGVSSTYESIRKRPFNELVDKIRILNGAIPFGINFLVNQKTVGDLTEAAELAEKLNAVEFLLLPEMAKGRGTSIDPHTKTIMQDWINNYKGRMKLSISESHTDGIPICEPFEKEVGLSAYAHIDAKGVLKTSSFEEEGVLISGIDVINALEILKKREEGLRE